MDTAEGLFASPQYLAEMGEPDHPRELSAFGLVGTAAPGTLTMWRPHAIGKFPVLQRARLATEAATMAAVVAGRGIGALPISFAVAQQQACQLVRVLPEWEILDPETISKDIEAAPESLRMFSL